MLAFCAVLVCLYVVPARAVVVTIDLGWGYGAGWTDATDAQNNLNDTYHLQEGSIIQVVMYNSATASPPGPEADDNFAYFGDYLGDPLDAVPIPTTGAETPGDITLYNPNSVPTDHVLAYQTTIGSSIADGAGQWYNIYEQFEILGTYDSLYIRVFGATDFPNGSVVASYWGLSVLYEGDSTLGTWYVGQNGELDNTVANHTNYFEVIPEPGTMALFLLGGAGLLTGRFRRKKHT